MTISLRADATGYGAIQVNGTDRAVLDASGNLGIGVTPSAWSGYGAPVIEMPSGGTVMTRGSTNVGANFYYSGGAFRYIASSAASYYNQNSGIHTWYTAPSGTAGNAITWTTAMTLDASGALLVGAGGTGTNTAPIRCNSGSGTGAYGAITFQKNGASDGFIGHRSAAIGGTSDDIAIFAESSNGIYTYTNGGTAGPYVSAGGTSWTNSSDISLKNVTGEIQNGLAKVASLTAAEFTWKADSTNKPQVGLIAQEVQAVLPEVVDESDGVLGVRYTEVIPLLVAAIKELKAENDALEARLATLEGK